MAHPAVAWRLIGGRGLVMATTRIGHAPADAERMEWIGAAAAAPPPALPRSTARRAISARP